MADNPKISQIKLPNGSTYDIEDNTSGYSKVHIVTYTSNYDEELEQDYLTFDATYTEVNNWLSNGELVVLDSRSTGRSYYPSGSDRGVLIFSNADGESIRFKNNNIGSYGESPFLTSSNLSEYETDPIFVASAAHGITSTDITNWNNKLDSYTETDPTVPAWAKATNKPSYTFSEIGSTPTTLSGYGITNAYTKTEIDGLVAGVLHYKGTKASVANLPSTGNTTGDVWHITADGSEYAWDGSIWQELGTAIDLSGYAQLAGASFTGPVTFGDSVTADELNTGDLVVTGSASFVNNIQANTINGVEVGSSPKFTDTVTIVSVTGSGNAVTAASASNGAVTLTKGATFLTSYTETDPVFSASAAAGITSTDISNWNAKVSDDKTWNGISLARQESTFTSDCYIPVSMSSTGSVSMSFTKATATPTAYKIVKYDNNAYLNSTTPSANDNSTKVATTAYVDAAIPDVSGYVSKSGDTMNGNLIMSANKLIFSISDSANIVIKHGQGGMNAPILDISAAENGAVYIRGVRSPSSITDAANKGYVDNAIPKVYSSTNTGGYLTMATLPIYDGTVV